MPDDVGLTITCTRCLRTWFVPGEQLDTWRHVWIHLRARCHWHFT